MPTKAKFHEITSLPLQDIKETKRYRLMDGQTDENSKPPLKLRFGGGGWVVGVGIKNENVNKVQTAQKFKFNTKT